MSTINIKVPSMGEGITDVTITRWLVSEGEMVEIDQPVVEIATDKVDSEIPAPKDGKIGKILKKEGDVVPVGMPVAIMECDEDTGTEGDGNENSSISKSILQDEDLVYPEDEMTTVTIQKHRFIPPYIRTLANEYSITLDELNSIKGSGGDDELQIEDVKKYILKKNSVEETEKLKKKQKFEILTSSTPLMVENNFYDNSEIIEMGHMRKLIADHMVRSKTISPHVTSFIEADVTNLVTWRNRVKDDFLNEEGEKLTYTPIFIEAVVKALQKYSMVNASVDKDKIYIKKYINIGVATALTNGNLIVPVIKDADKKSMTGLAKEVNDIVGRARQNKLNPSEIKGGTFTITNLGSFESMAGTPIINQPEVAILAIGAISRKPAVVKIDGVETIGIRDILVLSLAYDHRIIDGSLGGMFLKYVRDILQNFDLNRRI